MSIDRLYGIGRSLAMYYGVPFRSGKLRRFYAQFIHDGDLCFDIGAHVGNRVRCWRALGARVIALEPQPDFVRILAALFGNDPDVAIIAQAVGQTPGSATLLTSRRTPTVSTLSPQWAARVGAADSFRGVRWSPGPVVEVTTLDALIARHGEPAFVKVDVEGMELAVLQGLSQPLNALSFEFLPAAMDLAVACIARLAQLGDYSFNWSVGETLRLVAAQWLEPESITQVLAALPAGAGSGDIYARRRN